MDDTWTSIDKANFTLCIKIKEDRPQMVFEKNRKTPNNPFFY